MTMKFRLSLPFLFYIAITAMVFSSCSDDDNNGENKYADWKNRNDAYFLSVLNEAHRQIKLAKQEYPLDWEEHCDWRTYQSYSLAQGSTSNSAEDSICVKILRKGTGSGVPLSTDSVRVFYAGRLMPTDDFPDGEMFDHSGQSNDLSVIFDHSISRPSSFLVSSCNRGFATALQHMHIGDLWQIYIPAKLGYGNQLQGSVPAGSTLVFNIELVQYARAGNKLPVWN